MTKTRPPRRWRLAGTCALVGGLAAIGYLTFGGYNVAATDQHTAPIYALLDFASRRSIALRSSRVSVPAIAPEVANGRGLQLFREHCVQCHGAPGVAPASFALGLTPAPANLAATARRRKPAEVFWTMKYGLKMTAMPAWEFRLNDADIWAVTAFVGELALLSPEQYAKLVRATAPLKSSARLSAEAPTLAPDLDRARVAIQQYSCGTCHRIDGIVGAQDAVGPSLNGIGSRSYFAGALPNNRDNMIRWLTSPTTLRPHTAMPDLSVSERDARDIAAFLEQLR